MQAADEGGQNQAQVKNFEYIIGAAAGRAARAVLQPVSRGGRGRDRGRVGHGGVASGAGVAVASEPRVAHADDLDKAQVKRDAIRHSVGKMGLGGGANGYGRC